VIYWGTLGIVARAIKRRKPAAVRKDVFLRVRISEAHQREIAQAAQHAGITVSAWVTERILRCARDEAASRSK
jgi:hypothetical protein